MSQAGKFGTGGSTTGVVRTLTGDTGGAVSPDIAGNINVFGGGTSYINITTVGNTNPNELTVNLNDDVTLAGYLTAFGNITTAANFWMPETSSDGLHGIFQVDGISFIRTKNDDNMFIGFDAGNNTVTNTTRGSIGLGSQALQALTSGSYNTLIGFTSGKKINTGTYNTGLGANVLQEVTSATENVAIGSGALASVTSGSYNIAVGAGAGSSYASTEASNLVLSNTGVVGESNTIRIGTQGTGNQQQNRAFMAGVYNTTPAVANPLPVYIDSNGQLGTASSVGVYNYTLVNASPYTVLSTDEYLGVDTSSIAITIRLPNAPATGRSFTIKDKSGNSLTRNITVTTVGGVVLLDGATSYTMSTNYAAINVLFDGTGYQIF